MRYTLEKMKKTRMILLGFALLALAACAPKTGVKQYTPAMDAGYQALENAMQEIGSEKGDTDTLVLTNALSSVAEAKFAYPYFDVAMQATGQTPGTRSLLQINSPFSKELWYSLYNKKTNKAVFLRFEGDRFLKQSFNAAPETILTPQEWKKTASGIIGSSMFQVVSISLAWSANAPWPLLKSAELHNHLCPGLNSGYVVAEYVKKNMPLNPGESYVFIGASPNCAMDALQSIFDCTAGKKGVWTMRPGKKVVEKCGIKPFPTCIAMKVNSKENTTSGMVIGFDMNAACKDLGLNRADFAPPAGKKDPMFFIIRVKMSWLMAKMDMSEKLKYVYVEKEFSGNAKLALQLEYAGGNPYEFID